MCMRRLTYNIQKAKLRYIFVKIYVNHHLLLTHKTFLSHRLSLPL